MRKSNSRMVPHGAELLFTVNTESEVHGSALTLPVDISLHVCKKGHDSIAMWWVCSDELEPSVVEVRDTRIPEIWNKFHRRIRAIDSLEQNTEEHVKRCRRRMTGSFDQRLPFRRSQLRLFVSHENVSAVDGGLGNQWTLTLEGKMLTGIMDHAVAQSIDKNGSFTRPRQAPCKPPPLSTVLQDPSRSDLDNVINRVDRNKYRSVGEIEEDPVEPHLFTHAFDKLVVSFQTVWEPDITLPSLSALTPPKKSRKRRIETQLQLDTSVSTGLKKSPASYFHWTRGQSNDSHAFQINYIAPDAPKAMKFQCIVATITLHLLPTDILYKPSLAFLDAFFPSFGKLNVPDSVKEVKGEIYMKKEGITRENSIKSPRLLTLDEILTALSQYITVRKLVSHADESLVFCDEKLSELLGCESFNFGAIQQTLLSRQLITPLKSDGNPIILTYLMGAQFGGLMPQTPSKYDHGTKEVHDQALFFDVESTVPNFSPWRAREIMRRMKRREFEYTSSRTKARYMLVASRGSEDLTKAKIGEAISGQGYSEAYAPLFSALSKAAPPSSEARVAALLDAKICSIVGRLDEVSKKGSTLRNEPLHDESSLMQFSSYS